MLHDACWAFRKAYACIQISPSIKAYAVRKWFSSPLILSPLQRQTAKIKEIVLGNKMKNIVPGYKIKETVLRYKFSLIFAV